MTVLHPEWTAGVLPVPDWCPVPILQDRREFGMFHRWVMGQRVAAVIEVGSFYGGTLWHWSMMAGVRRIVAVDLPVPEADSRHRQAVACRQMWPEWMAGIDFHHLAGRSADSHILDEARRLGSYDFAFIDGDHTTQGVQADWDNYAPMVQPGGCVAFHDTVGIPAVAAVVDSLRPGHDAIDFRSASSDLGITVVYP